MKKLQYALLILALLVPAGLFAQGGDQGAPAGGPPPGGRHMPTVDEQLSHMSKDLNLTDAQKPQVKAILQDQRDQMKQVMDNSASREDAHAKMREIHEASATKIRALLTDDQKAKFDQMQERQHERMQQRHGGDQGSAPPPPQQ